MKASIQKGRLFFIIMALVFLGNKNPDALFPTHEKITISIDSLFVLRPGSHDDSSLKNNKKKLEKRVTYYIDSMLEKMAPVQGFVFVPNYRLTNKQRADYVLSGTFGKRMATNGFFKGSIEYFLNVNRKDNYSSVSEEGFSCSIKTNIKKDDRYLIRNKLLSPLMKGTMRSGFIAALVPINKLLHPYHSDSDNMSFSIDNYIKCAENLTARDRRAAKELTNILNNILVFNQPAYPNEFHFPDQYSYDYFQNYLRSNGNYKKADFNISGVLSFFNDSTYRLEISFSGKEINLIVPAKINTQITLDRKRIIKYHNYGEVLLKLHQIFPQVIFQQRF